jgi:hypothetical protein
VPVPAIRYKFPFLPSFFLWIQQELPTVALPALEKIVGKNAKLYTTIWGKKE